MAWGFPVVSPQYSRTSVGVTIGTRRINM